MQAQNRLPRRSDIRVVIAALAFAMILLGTLKPFYFGIYFHDIEAFGAYLSSFPYRKTPGLPAFLQSVRESTPPDAAIALWVPMSQWHEGYGYSYLRASYLLADRRVIPLVDQYDRRRTEWLEEAEYLASWQGAPDYEGFSPVWTSSEGVLWRRER